MKRNDFLLILILMIGAGFLYVLFSLGRNTGTSVVITVDGKNPQTYELKENQTFEVIGYNGGSCIITIKDGSICVREADCPDHSCIKKGWIQKNGDTIACLPNRVLIEIEGNENSSFDSIAK